MVPANFNDDAMAGNSIDYTLGIVTNVAAGIQRCDLLRERRRIAALEAAKWRKEATRRCRNCSTAYKDQNPAGGRFMCTYCGHVSRRPVLDISNVAIHGNSNGIAASGAPLPASIAQSGIGDLGFSGNLYLMQLIFDAFPYALSTALFEVLREEGFAPVKNASSNATDTPVTARISGFHTYKWWTAH